MLNFQVDDLDAVLEKLSSSMATAYWPGLLGEDSRV